MKLGLSVVSTLGALALGACADAPTAIAPRAQRAVPVAAAGVDTTATFLVRFKATGLPDDFSDQIAALGGQVIFAHAGVGIAAVSGLNAGAADQVAARSDVVAVDADAYTTLESDVAGAPVEASVVADATTASVSNPAGAYFYGLQWNMRAVSAPAAWAAGRLGTPGVRVGILDTGIDYLHPDLYGRVDLTLSRSFLPAAEDARVQAAFPGAHPIADLNYHGTHVAATVASNGLVTAGVTSKVTLVGLKVCAPGSAANGYGGTCATSSTLAGILYAADQGLDVINMSLGGSFLRSDASARGGNGPSLLATINRVMNYANRKGTAVVVSAGNSAVDLDHDGNLYASYCDAAAVICVSATGPTGAALSGTSYVSLTDVDALAPYSNYGRSAITVAAPGGNAIPVWGACSGFTIHPGLAGCRNRFYNATTGKWSGRIVGLAGTSMAAPHVTGTAALIAGVVGHDPAQISAQLQQSADDLGQPGADPAYGKGRINVARAAGL